MSMVEKCCVNSRSFDRFLATATLKELAKHPCDLTDPHLLTPARLQQLSAEACGIKFLYGTEQVTEEVMQALVELSREAGVLQEMKKMQAGEVVNKIEGFPSENRKVLHTAVRDFFEAPNQAKEACEATKEAKKEIDKLQHFINKIDKDQRFTDLIMIGIGGSDLGPKAHYIALQPLQKKGRKVHFISNVDPDDAAMVLKNVDLSTTLVVCVSKSGTTLETLTNEEIVRSHFQKASLHPRNHFIAVTGRGSPMDNPQQYLESFYIWDWIGGRYSTTSMVGGVMLSFAFGFEVFWELLRGANAMDKVALNPSIKHNLPLLGALLGIWNRNFLGHPTVALIPYSQALSRFPAHIQQLDMESNGKHTDRRGNQVNFQTGPIIWGEPGTNAQHSFFQLIHQGTAPIPVEFIGFKESQHKKDFLYKGTYSQEKLLANLFAQAIALAAGQKNPDNINKSFFGNRPSHILLARQLTPHILGSLLAYFEHKVAFEGFIWGINSFDQEGVQLGKILANKIIDQFSFKRGIGEKSEFALGEAMIRHLETL
ncbi:glucose-6-phosphate isomerase [Neochlamydia sp. S13]|nr:glucose-6-phosphate isomerase [Neochlamydia sp. S13]BBI17229.1 glucose-6-phosphate isomerase [Neochlamydia sp. S13]